MIGRGYGRGRSQNEYLPKSEDRERRSSFGANPPSRSLWVGSLNSHVTRSLLAEHFMRFGEIENIGFIPGRTFAFVNFKKVEDAIIAKQGLQGFNLGGMALKIEFAKADKSAMIPNDELFPHYDDSIQSVEREKSLLQRDLRPTIRPSPEKPYEKSKGSSSTGNKHADPSEILWIGFPSSLHVDEAILWRAFSPFGEIEKISTFPGRTYAFVRYKTILSACRAKEALQGRLFNNPRVNICFARNESSTEQGRGPPISYPLSRSDQSGLETFHRERSFESPFRGEFRMTSPGMPSNFRGRNDTIRASLASELNFSSTFEERIVELGSKRRMVDEPIQVDIRTPDKPAPWLDFSFGKTRAEHVLPPHEDLLGPGNGSFAMVKKTRINPIPDNELPEYPFSDLEQGKHRYNPVISKVYSQLPEQTRYSKSFESLASGLEEDQGLLRNIRQNEQWKKFDGPSVAPGLSMERFSPDRPKTMVNSDEWKWEGTIARGGTKICHARCFPVGKVLDFALPDVLDCTARTGIDMLSKHYYQATSTWVVFFVPGSDSDINSYNEYMHMLGEKKRAAVVKLDEKASLFLVPPSDFSEQVLKVPGKVSMSGVVLKFQDTSSSFSSVNNQIEATKPKHDSIVSSYDNGKHVYGDSSFLRQKLLDSVKQISQDEDLYGASRHAPPLPSFPPSNKITESDFYSENRPVSTTAVSRSFGNPKVEEYAPILPQSQPVTLTNYNPEVPNAILSHGSSNNYNPEFSNALSSLVSKFAPQKQEASSNNYNPEISNVISSLVGNFGQQKQEAKTQATTSTQLPLRSDQLAQLASILGQQKQFANLRSQSETNTQSVLPQNSSSQAPIFSQPEVPTRATPALFGSQVPNVAAVQQSDGYQVQDNSHQTSNTNTEEPDPEAQKRLQATLQLAAVLLQQIHQPRKP